MNSLILPPVSKSLLILQRGMVPWSGLGCLEV